MTGLLLIALLLPDVGLAAPPTVEEAGAEPHAPLRYAPSQGASFSFKLTTTLRSSQNIAGQASTTLMPPTEFAGTATVEHSDPTAIRLVVQFDAITVQELPALAKSTLRTLKRSWARLAGMKVRVTLSPAGVQTQAKLVLPKDTELPKSLAEPLQSLFQAIRSLHVPLPDQPVGQGAQWVVTREQSTGGVAYSQRTVWTLASRQKNRLELAFETTASAPGQGFEAGDMPAGMTARVKSLTGQAKGTLTVDLAGPVCTQMKASDQLELVLEGRAGRRPFEISTRAETTTTVQPRKKPSARRRGHKR